MELKLFSMTKPHTYLGFPVEPPDEFESERPRKGNKSLRERGIAMLTAILVTSLMFISLADMMVNSQVSLEMAIGIRDGIKAEYLAKSGENLGLFVILADLGIDLFTFQQTKTPPTDGPEDLWTHLNDVPIGPDEIRMLRDTGGIKLSEVNDSETLATLDSFDGKFTIKIEDEGAKLNINYCTRNDGLPCRKLLTALMSCPAEREYLEKKKWRPEEIVANIADWVDDTSTVTEGSRYSGENDPYAEREPPMRVKNAPFDSLDELKAVEGWDDDLHKIFSPYLTVYPVQEIRDQVARININSNLVPMMACLIKDAGEECRKNAIIKSIPAKPVDRLGNVGSTQAVLQRLNTIFCRNDKDDSKNFTYRSDIFRLSIEGSVGDQIRKLSMVIQRGPPNKVDLKNEFKGAYKILEWKML